MTKDTFKIGTRGSPLALCQANIVKGELERAHPALKVEIVAIKSDADWKKSEGEKPLSEEAGGKGLFAKEIEAAILKGEVDCGVHSLKDMASFLEDGLILSHFLPRANPHDALISKNYKHLSNLPKGAVLGTCSARRKAIALSLRPDLEVVAFRGNVQTRIDKITAGQVDVTFLAMAGIERLGIHSDNIHPLSSAEMLPACGQGIVCIETREGDEKTQEILNPINCEKTQLCALAEREVLRALDGSCHTPIAAFAEIIGDRLNLRAEVYALDGQEVFRKTASGLCVSIEDALEIGVQVGQALNDIVPDGFMI